MKKFILFVGAIALISFLGLYVLTRPPQDGVFPVTVSYISGEPVGSFAQNLFDQKIIKNQKLFKILFVLEGYDRTLKPSNYIFEQPLALFEVVQKIGGESVRSKGVKIVIPEGTTVAEVKGIVERAFPLLETNKNDTAQFNKSDEGYLFPDTYYFSQNVQEADIVRKLKETFTEKTQSIFAGKTNEQINDIIIMASILEKEGRNLEERKIISGILWKRIELGMPLQVDATFLYTLGKGSRELTLNDLQKDGPYNTYTRKGLPVAPINNPGLETIEAAINPVSSPYLYYLHDSLGQAHYAKDFEGHKKNKALYLKN